MSSPLSMTSKQLASFWKISLSTLRTLVEAGEITPAATNCFLHQAIDDFHRRHQANIDNMPPVAEIKRRGGMLRSPQVATMLGIAQPTLTENTKRPDGVPVIRIKKKILRYPACLVNEYAAPSAEPWLTLQDALFVLCSNISTMDPRALPRIRPRGHTWLGNESFVATASVDALLLELLPPYVAPAKWRQEVLARRPQFYMQKDVVAACHTNEKVIMELAERLRLPFIKNARKNIIRFPEWSLVALKAFTTKQDASTVAALFGVEAVMAQEWLDNHRFCNRRRQRVGVHTRSRCPTFECVRYYIEAHRNSDTVDADSWLLRALAGGRPPLTGSTLIGAIPKLTPAKLVTAIKKGEVRGVWLPDGGITILNSDAVAVLT